MACVPLPVPATPALLALERFLASAREPALLEPGEELFPLVAGSWSYELRSSHILLQAWDDRRNLSRRIIAAHLETKGKLALTIQLFGGRAGKMYLLDLASPRAVEWKRRGTKLVFRERFRQFLSREFPDWRTAELSSEPDLQHSLSPAYPRALLIRGNRALAAIGAAPEATDPAQVLTFGLIWLAYLRQRAAKRKVDSLVIMLPAGSEKPVAQRLLWLDPQAARYELFTYNEDDFAQRIDPADAGNIESALTCCRQAPSPGILIDALNEIPGFERMERPDGTASLRIHGLEFASSPTRKTTSELLAHAAQLSQLRGEKGGALHQKNPERWLESEVRRHLETIDASLYPAPVYGQVPAFASGDRGVADLLACDRSGQLTVLELKASSDIHLPLQALDYWMRVRHHAARCDFLGHGYFPGISVSPQPPKLLLVAPSLEFHPSTETILRFFSPEVAVQRIGLAAGWRDEVRVMFRLSGAEHP